MLSVLVIKNNMSNKKQYKSSYLYMVYFQLQMNIKKE